MRNFIKMGGKNFSEEAKDLFSSWKKELEEKDGHILERKKKRDRENEQLYQDLQNAFNEVKETVNKDAEQAFKIFAKEFKEFAETVQEGAVDLYKKAELEKHAQQLFDFLDKIKSRSAEKFKDITGRIKDKLSEDDFEFVSERETDFKNNENEPVETLLKQAGTNFDNEQ